MWDKMTKRIKTVAKEQLGESRGFGHRIRNLGGGTKMWREES